MAEDKFYRLLAQRPSTERTEPAVPGLNAGRITATMSPDSWRTSQNPRKRKGQAPFSGSGHAQRFGVKPWSGKTADIHSGSSASDPMIEPENPLTGTIARTPRQSRLVQAARAYTAGVLGSRQAATLREIREECDALAAYEHEPTTALVHQVREAVGI